MKISCSIIMAVLLVFLLAGCVNSPAPEVEPTLTPTSTSTPEPTPTPTPEPTKEPIATFNVDEYRTNISDAKDELEKLYIPLGNMATYQANYIKNLNNLGGKFESEKVFNNAVEWMEEKSDYLFDDVSVGFEEATKKYKEILAIETQGGEAEKLQELYFNLYDALCELYFTVTQPSKSTFADSVTNSMDNFMEAYNKLDALLSAA